MTFAQAVWRPNAEQIIDTHCHYNLDPLWPQWRAHWEKARAMGVGASWIPGTSLATSHRAVSIAAEDERLFAWVGIHPADGGLGEDRESSLAELAATITADRQRPRPVIIGIGEIGLDYFRLEAADRHTRALQREWFVAQLELARRFSLPVMLHVRDQSTPESPTPDNAYWDMVALLEHWSLPFSLHCVSGPQAYVRTLVARGAYCGFDGNITYPKAESIRDLYRLTPPERRLLETDAPYLPPQGHRGAVCEPWMIAETAAWVRSHLAS